MALVDARYRFLFVEIGGCGRRSDGGIFQDSAMGKAFEAKRMNLPPPRPIEPDGPKMPYVIVADEAFRLCDYMMRPYPGRGGLTEEKRIFNYRLSRARRIVENVFGIITQKFRILKSPLSGSLRLTRAIVKAIVVLHNFIKRRDVGRNNYMTPGLVDEEKEDGTFTPGSWREASDTQPGLHDINRPVENSATESGKRIRDQFCSFFNGPGAIKFQYNRC